MTVPEIYAADHPHGLVLMEDFGDERYYELIVGKKEPLDKLYGFAVDALVHKFNADPAIALDQSAAYSDDYWMFRVEQFLQYYLPHVLGRNATEGEREDFIGVYRAAVTAAHKFDPVLLHGDYGAQNLYFMPDRPGIKAVGLIDFQDLTDARGNMMGSPAFDLVFLLQDVRVEVAPALEKAMRDRFIVQAKIADVSDFEGVYATIGTAQATKCLGLFARLGHVAGRKEYLDFIPYCWRNLANNLSHPEMKGIREWFEKNKIDIEKGH
jgi:aminoglycoside/choline kinase family phosphotransferase